MTETAAADMSIAAKIVNRRRSRSTSIAAAAIPRPWDARHDAQASAHFYRSLHYATRAGGAARLGSFLTTTPCRRPLTSSGRQRPRRVKT